MAKKHARDPKTYSPISRVEVNFRVIHTTIIEVVVLCLLMAHAVRLIVSEWENILDTTSFLS